MQAGAGLRQVFLHKCWLRGNPALGGQGCMCPKHAHPDLSLTSTALPVRLQDPASPAGALHSPVCVSTRLCTAPIAYKAAPTCGDTVEG